MRNHLIRTRRWLQVWMWISLMLLATSPLHGQVTWFHDSFQDTTVSPQWRCVSGNWHADQGAVSITTREYDQLLASTYYVRSAAAYSFQVELKGARAGVFFSLDDTTSKALSHMVRFDENSILTGSFDAAGVFTATNTFDLPPSPKAWRTLSVTVNPLASDYVVSVDGELVGRDTCLMFKSGFVGLQASEGFSAFRSVTLSAATLPPTATEMAVGSVLHVEHLKYIDSRSEFIRLYHPEQRKYITVDERGIVTAVEPSPSPPAITTAVDHAGRRYIIRGNKILIYSGKQIASDSLAGFLVAPSCLLLHGDDVLVADAGARCVFEYSRDGRLKRTLRAGAIGGFKAPRGLALLKTGALAVADYDRIVILPPDLEEHPDTLSPGPNGTMVLRWESDATTEGWVEFASDGNPWKRVPAQRSREGSAWSVELRNLNPLTRYSYRYFPAIKTIPGTSSLSRMFRTTTPPSSPAAMAMTRLPVMCLVYRTISYRTKYPASTYRNIPDGRTLSEQDVNCLRESVEFNRAFYFRNSGCRLVLDFDFFVVEDTLNLEEVGASDPYWLGPNERVTRDFESAAKSFGRSPDFYAGVVCPYAWINYPPRRTSALRDPGREDTITIRQAVGGGTYGVPAPWKYGKTTGYTSNPFQDRFSRQDWLITHEFHHQLDALMDASGFPEYYHADQPWKMPGSFGEDFDFNGHIMRNADASSWLALRFGALVQSSDGDRDGVPDSDPSLPFDEKRLESSPASADSDADGVSDLAEIMMGITRGSDPTNSDSDGDGIADGYDEEPLYPISPSIPRAESGEDLLVHPFGSIRDSVLSATLHVGWTDSALLVSCVSSIPVNLLLQIDADNDGWFHGFDNYQIRILNKGDSARVADFYLRDCSSWTDPPRERRDILHASDLQLRSQMSPAPGQQGATYQITFVVPRDNMHSLDLKPGKRLGIRFGVQSQTDLWVWNELFERNRMMQVTLR